MIRDCLIDKIKHLELLNLNYLEQSATTYINDKNLLKRFCFLAEKTHKSHIDFKHFLIVLDKYLNFEQIKIAKECI